jgi:hypothetical protein
MRPLVCARQAACLRALQLVQPFAEEREEVQGGGRVSVEHISSGTPMVPHEVQEPQTGEEDMD